MGDPKPPPSRKKGPSVLLVLIALMSLAVSLYVVAAFVPILSCPPCEGTGELKMIYNYPKTGMTGRMGGECPSCKGKGRITLLQKFNIAPLDPSLLPVPDFKK
jgi:hypothetical protein